jgi:mannose-6-phosphate isomerase-like protein (cupin superfamily)
MPPHALGNGFFAPLAALVLTTAACGSSKEWAPPPVGGTIPVAPVGPAEKGGSSGSGAAELEALAAGSGGTTEAPPADKPASPSAMPGALPTDIDGKLAAHTVCAQKECAVPGLYPPIPALAAGDAKSPAAVWSHDIQAAGSSVSFPRHAGLDLFGVVLKGGVKLKGAETADAGPSAAAWVAFRAPGAGLSVTASEANTRVIFALVSPGDPIVGAAAAIRGKDAKTLAWKDRSSPLQVVDLNASKDLAWGGGSMHARMGIEGDVQRASLSVLMASKDAPVASHKHDTSWEILIALRAEGTAQRAASAEATETAPVKVTDGMVVAIPKGALHAWQPAGSKPLIALQIYVPPGPEQRFKKLAE